MAFKSDRQRKGFFSRLFHKKQCKTGLPPPPPESMNGPSEWELQRAAIEESNERLIDPEMHKLKFKNVKDEDIRKAAMEWERQKQVDKAREEIERYKARQEILKYKKARGLN